MTHLIGGEATAYGTGARVSRRDSRRRDRLGGSSRSAACGD